MLNNVPLDELEDRDADGSQPQRCMPAISRPFDILFAALAVGQTEPLKTLLSPIGALTSRVWLYRIWEWTGLNPADQKSVLALAGIFGLSWVVALVVHGYHWARRIRS